MRLGFRVFQLRLRLAGIFVCPRRGHVEFLVTGHAAEEIQVVKCCRRCGSRLAVDEFEGRYPLPAARRRVVL